MSMLMAPERDFAGEETACAAEKHRRRDHIFQTAWQGLDERHRTRCLFSNRYLEPGEKRLGTAELIPSKGSVCKMSVEAEQPKTSSWCGRQWGGAAGHQQRHVGLHVCAIAREIRINRAPVLCISDRLLPGGSKFLDPWVQVTSPASVEPTVHPLINPGFAEVFSSLLTYSLDVPGW